MITTPHHYLISVFRGGLYFVSVCTAEMMPLFVIEFLHRVVDTFKDYFGDCTESLIKEHYVVIASDSAVLQFVFIADCTGKRAFGEI